MAFAAYRIGASELLLAMACVTPLVMILTPRLRLHRAPDKQTDTGAVEQATLLHEMDEALSNGPTHRKMACVAISIDNFTELRQDWDIGACDEAVFKSLERIKSVLRSEDILARLEDAEFVLFIPSLRAPETSAVLALCDRLLTVTKPPVHIDGHALHLSLSAGFCMNTRAPAQTGTAMLGAARAALKEARQNGPGAVRAYSKNTRMPVESYLANEALQALRDGKITTWFQPQVSTDTGEITGFETLARWDHPERGVLLPEEFVHLFDDSNRMEEFGEKVFDNALRALLAWDEAGVCVPSVSANFATQQLRNPSLVERIKWDVDRYGLDPSRLTVEVLENVIADREDDIITRNIRALRSQGFRIDLDDFGTGHASIANIRRFAVDRIKIDRSFVANADTDPDQQRMIAAIVSLSERLGIQTLAEGVETPSELSFLSQLGCTHLQGFAVARPMPFEQTLDWIAQHNVRLQQAQIVAKRLP